MSINWVHMKLTVIIFKGQENKSIRNQSHIPTNAHTQN